MRCHSADWVEIVVWQAPREKELEREGERECEGGRETEREGGKRTSSSVWAAFERQSQRQSFMLYSLLLCCCCCFAFVLGTSYKPWQDRRCVQLVKVKRCVRLSLFTKQIVEYKKLFPILSSSRSCGVRTVVKKGDYHKLGSRCRSCQDTKKNCSIRFVPVFLVICAIFSECALWDEWKRVEIGW